MKPTETPSWHSLSPAQALSELAASPGGLGSAEAADRLAIHGPNRLTPPARVSAFVRFLGQFHNTLIYVLLGAALITGLLGHWVDTGVIVGVVLINALIGFLQEGKAEKSLEAIRNMLSLQAVVLRDGHRCVLAAQALVPGDIVLLASGDKVPADLRLLEARNLRIEEAALTGEAEPVEKAVAAVEAAAVLGDRRSMAYSGTLVVFGQARALVVATADRTEIGRIGRMLAEVDAVQTPLLRQMATFGHWLSAGILGLAVLTMAFGMLVHGLPAGEMFLAAVGLAVAAIPEGLPAIMTITLAIGVQRMARRHAIVRRMPAVETLGAVTVICTDKTGTLTRNEMTVQRLVMADGEISVTGTGYAPHGDFRGSGQPLTVGHRTGLLAMARAGAFCNDARLRERGGDWHIEGDPTEGALLTLAMKAGLDVQGEQAAHPREDTLPFESDHQFMATRHRGPAGERFVFVKGAPERVLAMCATQLHETGCKALQPAFWLEAVERLAGEGFRVLALARGGAEVALETLVARRELVLMGLVAIMDPPRPEAVSAVARCREAGIRVKMITGDHAATACAIARNMGFAHHDRALTGAQVEALDDAALRRAVQDVDVFARASPEHKLRLVQALQAQGEVVAMTGDGVNDAPALKRADVGVAMGHKGTEAAKEAAAMVLADDNFASIAAAVEEGRTVYDNLRKAVLYILPTSSAQAAMVVIAVLAGMTLPITPVQILWVNMVIAVTMSLAIAFERPEPGLMRRRPRSPAEPLVNGFMLWRIGFVTVLMSLASFGGFLWLSAAGAELALARTMAVNVLVIGQLCYLFNCRRMTDSILSREGMLGNPHVLKAAAVLVVLQLAFTYLPWMQALFGTAGLAAAHWAGIAVAGGLLLLVVEAEKRWWRAR